MAEHSFQWDTTTVANGPVTITVEALDSSGNVLASADRDFTIDNVAAPDHYDLTYLVTSATVASLERQLALSRSIHTETRNQPSAGRHLTKGIRVLVNNVRRTQRHFGRTVSMLTPARVTLSRYKSLGYRFLTTTASVTSAVLDRSKSVLVLVTTPVSVRLGRGVSLTKRVTTPSVTVLTQARALSKYITTVAHNAVSVGVRTISETLLTFHIDTHQSVRLNRLVSLTRNIRIPSSSATSMARAKALTRTILVPVGQRVRVSLHSAATMFVVVPVHSVVRVTRGFTISLRSVVSSVTSLGSSLRRLLRRYTSVMFKPHEYTTVQSASDERWSARALTQERWTTTQSRKHTGSDLS